MERIVPVLGIDDYRDAVTFYVDKLGFSITFEHRHEPGFPVFMGLKKGELILSLSEHARGEPGSEIYVFVEDVEAWSALLADGDITPLEPPTRRPWGNTEMVVRDPFRNTLRFTQIGTHPGAPTPNHE